MSNTKATTLTVRFDKLHKILQYVEDTTTAIKMQSGRMLSFNPDEIKNKAYNNLSDTIEQWRAEIKTLASMFRDTESQYEIYNGKGILEDTPRDAVPTYAASEIPDPFVMSEKLYQIGFYKLDDDMYGANKKEFSLDEIVADIEKLRGYTSFCLKALANMKYEGVWGDVGEKVRKVIDSYYTGRDMVITDFLNIYNYKTI